MSGAAGGTTTLVLQVRADKAGLTELQTAFASLNASITANLDKLGAASRAAASGGAQELAALKADLNELKAAMGTAQQLIIETGNKAVEAQEKRAVATRAATEASRQARAAMQAEAEAARDLQSGLRGLAGGLGVLWTTYGAFLPLLSGFALSAGIKKAIDVGSEFTYQMQFAGAISDATAKDLDKLTASFEQLSEKSAFSATDAAQGYRVLAQAGFDAQDTLKIMPDLLKFSTVGEIDLARAAEIAAGQMHAFGLTVNDIPHILNSTAKAAAVSQTTIQEMGQALRQASTVAQQFGLSVDDMNSLLAVLAQRNIRGSAAGTALMNMLRNLDPQSVKAKEAFKALNVSITDGEGNFRKIIPLVQEFADKFAKFDQASQSRIAEAYFNNRGAKAALAAIAGAHDELVTFNTELQHSDGYLNKVSDALGQTFTIQAKEALHALQNDLIEAFKAVGPELSSLAEQFKNLFSSQDFKDGLKNVLQGFASLSQFLLDHGKLIATLAVGWIGLKAAMLVGGTIIGGVVSLTSAVKDLGIAMAALNVVGGGAAGAAAGVSRAVQGGLIGLALFGGWEVGDYLSKLSAIQKGTTLFLDLFFTKENAYAGSNPNGSGERRSKLDNRLADEWQAAQAARLRRERDQRSLQDPEIQRMLGTAARASATPAEIARAQQDRPKAGSAVFDPDAIKEAERQAQAQIQLENSTYHELLSVEKSAFNNQLSVLRAYHGARLISDDEFSASEKQLTESQQNVEEHLYTVHIAKLMELRKKAGDDAKEQARIDAEISKAQEERYKRVEQYETQAVTDAARAWQTYNNQSNSALESITNANKKLAEQIDAEKNFSAIKKDNILTTAEARLKTDEETLARLQNEAATWDQCTALTAKQEATLKEIDYLKAETEAEKKAILERKNLIKEEKQVESDWRVAAVNGLNQYLDTAGSTTKAMADAFKKGFSAMEDALVNFVMTGKFNFKSFADSVIQDIARMVVRMEITIPLATALQAVLSGGGFNLGSAGGILSLIAGGSGSSGGSSVGGIVNGASTLGSLWGFGSSLWSGSSAGGLSGSAGAWLGARFGANGLGGYLTGTPAAAYVDTLGNAASGAVAGQATNSATSGLVGVGGQFTGWASTLLKFLPIVGWIAAGVMKSMSLYNSGWTGENLAGFAQTRDFSHPTNVLAGNEPTTLITEGAQHLLRAFGVNSKWAAILSGVTGMSRLFGWSATHADARGIDGTINASDVTGENWQDYSQQGGYFRGDRRWTDHAAFTSDQNTFMAQMMAPINEAAAAIGQILHIDPKQALAGYSHAFNIQTTENGNPLSDAEMNQKFQDLFGAVLQEQVTQLMTAGGHDKLAEYVKGITGTTDQITQAVGDFVNVFTALPNLHMKVDVESLLAWRKGNESLADVYNNLSQSLQQFDQAFKPAANNFKDAQDLINSSFKDLGLTVPKTNADFYNLVHGLDLTTESGRHAFETLMQVAPAFDAVQQSVSNAIANFNQIMGQIRGPQFTQGVLQGTLSSQLGDFMSQNSWTQGHNADWVMQQLLTITPGDFVNYANGGQGDLLNSIFSTWQQLHDASGQATDGLSQLAPAASSAVSALEQAKASLQDWAQSKLLSSDSPLLPAEKLNTALDAYQNIVNAGDVSNFSGAADALLSQGRSYYGSSDQYTALFNRVMQDAQRLGGFKLDYQSNVQAASIDQMRKDLLVELQLARTDNQKLQQQVRDLIQAINNMAGDTESAIGQSAETISRAVTNAVESMSS